MPESCCTCTDTIHTVLLHACSFTLMYSSLNLRLVNTFWGILYDVYTCTAPPHLKEKKSSVNAYFIYSH